MQSGYFLFVLFFLILFIYPIKMNIKLSYDTYKNRGVISVKIAFFKTSLASFKIKNYSIQVKTRYTKKQQELELKVDKQQFIYMKRLLAQFRDKLKITSLNLYTTIGFQDAFKSAMISGLIGSVSYAIFAFIKNFKQTAGIKVKTKTEYNKDIFRTRVNTKVSINLLDFSYCLLFAFIQTRRVNLYEQEISQRKHSGKTFGYKYSKN